MHTCFPKTFTFLPYAIGVDILLNFASSKSSSYYLITLIYIPYNSYEFEHLFLQLNFFFYSYHSVYFPIGLFVLSVCKNSLYIIAINCITDIFTNLMLVF